jgi:hypothetical protein
MDCCRHTVMSFERFKKTPHIEKCAGFFVGLWRLDV